MHAQSKPHTHKARILIKDLGGHRLMHKQRVVKCAFVEFARISKVLQPLTGAKISWHCNLSSCMHSGYCCIGDQKWRRLKLKHTWQVTPCLYVLLQIMNGRLPTGSKNFNHGG